jgi:hypothetical protein
MLKYIYYLFDFIKLYASPYYYVCDKLLTYENINYGYTEIKKIKNRDNEDIELKSIKID